MSIARDFTAVILRDEPAMTAGLRQVMEDGGIRTVELTSPEDTLQYLEQTETSIDLLAVSMHLDGAGWLSFLKEIRSRYSEIELPVLMISGKIAAAEVIAAFDNGANEHITTNVHPPIALARVRNLIRLTNDSIRSEIRQPAFFEREGGPKKRNLIPGEEYGVTYAYIDLRVPDSTATRRGADYVQKLVADLNRHITKTATDYGGRLMEQRNDGCILAFYDVDHEDAVYAGVELMSKHLLYSMLDDTTDPVVMNVGMVYEVGAFAESIKDVYSDALNRAAHAAKKSRGRQELLISDLLFQALGDKGAWYFQPVESEAKGDFFLYKG